MNDPISWDPSLVKKFSSSNHFKLLNQLRNEVKKYPLNNKKNSKSIMNNGGNQDNKDKTNDEVIQNVKLTKNLTKLNDLNSDKSNVSFNNSKNFSIYNQDNNNNINRQNESHLNEHSKISDEPSSSSFKERLDKIDMK